MQNPTEVIKLTGVQGIARLSGTDEHGNVWTQFEIDAFAEQEEGMCGICGATLTSGWLCLDSGEEVCDEHVELPEGER